MELELIAGSDVSLALLKKKEERIHSLQDAIDVLGNAHYLGATGIIVDKDQLPPEFFDLKTGLAGDILQKFSNYRMKLAITGDFSEYSSKSLSDFIYESNKLGQINFCKDLSEAKAALNQR